MEGQIGQHIQFNLIQLNLIKNIFFVPYNINCINVLTHINELGSGVKINIRYYSCLQITHNLMRQNYIKQ